MPCNCDHMEPTEHERESRKLCKLIVYVYKAQHHVAPVWIQEGAKDVYGKSSQVHFLTETLCKLCTDMKPEERLKIIYNGTDADSRKLADWWDAHKAADAQKLKDAKWRAHQQRVKDGALAKLTKAERKVLGYK